MDVNCSWGGCSFYKRLCGHLVFLARGTDMEGPLSKAPHCPLDTAQGLSARGLHAPATLAFCSRSPGPGCPFVPSAFMMSQLSHHPLRWGCLGSRSPAIPLLVLAPAPLVVCLPCCPVSCIRTETVPQVIQDPRPCSHARPVGRAAHTSEGWDACVRTVAPRGGSLLVQPLLPSDFSRRVL